MKYVLGLDLGVTSVGWGILEEETYNIVDYGVRLFEESDAANNLKRRTARGMRRLKARKKNRINAIRYYLKQIGIVDNVDFMPMNNIYELRVKGLNNKLTNLELANVLVNIAKHRGSSLEIAVDESDTEAAKSSSSLSENTKILLRENKYVCELQLERYIKDGEVRNTNNIFRTVDYEKELRKILSNQELTDEQVEKIVEIVVRRRHFSEGPGSEEFPTPYGSYRYEIENGVEVLKHVNLIDVMRGKCSIYPNEPRCAKNTYTSCLFNLLNDLNNLKIDNGIEKVKLSEEQKNYIITTYINETGGITPKALAKYLGVSVENISGFRIDSKKNPLLTEFKVFKKMLKDDVNKLIVDNYDCFDQIVEILTNTQVVDERKEKIKALVNNIPDDLLEKIASYTQVNGYHSLSKKAMNEMIPELLSTSLNQMQIIENNGLGKNENSLISNEISADDSAILSPVAKKVQRQAFKVVNDLRKRYGEFSSIVIETTRAKNSDDEKKQIIEKQKLFEENKKKADELIKEMKIDPGKINSLTKLKIKLYKEQNCKTIYAGQTIDLVKLINDPTAYQIEHIIPYSISFDNSLNNKALASAKENQDKGNRTPFMYFASGKVDGPINTFEKFEAVVNSLYQNKQITKAKRDNLLNQDDISKFSNMEEFVSRNLNDTSYGIRVVLNTLDDYFKANNISTKVFTVRGKVTHAFRSRVGMGDKDRNDYIHHAIDALIIAGFRNQKIFNNVFELEAVDNELVANKITGEILNLENPLKDSIFLNYLCKLKNIQGTPYDFSYAVDTKTNRQFSDETIYSTRVVDGEEYVVKKYKDIYGKEGESLAKLLRDEKKRNSLLMAKNDVQTYELLLEITDYYKGEKNPYAKYKEQNGYIKKVSKRDNGPVIKSVKYISGKLNSCKSISHKLKFKPKNKNVVLLQLTPYRADVYLDNGIYKFLTIKMNDINYKDGKNNIERDYYNSLLEKKKISKNAKFLFSLNRNNIIKLEFDKSDNDNNMYRFKGVKTDDKNVIEVDYIHKKSDVRLTPTIGKSVVKFEKYNVSPSGIYSKVESETLKLEW
jgi:CRISPR-associated endonuclease Csn1